MSEVEVAKPAHREIHCSFCGKSQIDVEILISGPGVNICNECVELSARVLDENRGKPVDQEKRFQDYWPTEILMKRLKLHDNAFAALDRSMQDIVDILRERDVSWAQIGEALGVSRQAAWKRFG